MKTYIAIDLKPFYASGECVARGLDPLTTNLVVTDDSRTEKTICLAVSPSLKACGIPCCARLFEVVQNVRAVNVQRRIFALGHRFTGKSSDAVERNRQFGFLAEHQKVQKEVSIEYFIPGERKNKVIANPKEY